MISIALLVIKMFDFNFVNSANRPQGSRGTINNGELLVCKVLYSNIWQKHSCIKPFSLIKISSPYCMIHLTSQKQRKRKLLYSRHFRFRFSADNKVTLLNPRRNKAINNSYTETRSGFACAPTRMRCDASLFF